MWSQEVGVEQEVGAEQEVGVEPGSWWGREVVWPELCQGGRLGEASCGWARMKGFGGLGGRSGYRFS